MCGMSTLAFFMHLPSLGISAAQQRLTYVFGEFGAQIRISMLQVLEIFGKSQLVLFWILRQGVSSFFVYLRAGFRINQTLKNGELGGNTSKNVKIVHFPFQFCQINVKFVVFRLVSLFLMGQKSFGKWSCIQNWVEMG